MSEHDIEIDRDQFVKLDYLKERIDTDNVTISSDKSYNEYESQAKKYVFDPSDSGVYTITNNSNGTELTVKVDSTIPDSVVSRGADHDKFVVKDKYGIKFNTSQEWPKIQGKISSKSSGFSTAYVEKTDGTVIDSVDISGLSAGDVFTFDSANLSASTSYYMLIDNNERDWTFGQDDKVGGLPYDYTSTDDNLSITDGVSITAFGGDTDEFSYAAPAVREIGNINL